MKRIAPFAALVAVTLPSLAAACEGCKSVSQDNGTPNAIGEAFGISIYFMIAFPMLLVLGMIILGVRQVRQIEAERARAAVGAGA